MSILVNIPLVLHDFCEKKAKSTEINSFCLGNYTLFQTLDTFRSFKDLIKCHLLFEAFPSGQVILPPTDGKNPKP